MKTLLLLSFLTLTTLTAQAFEPLFEARIDYLTPLGTQSLIVNDFNGDGYTDFACVNFSSGYYNGPDSITVYLNNGDGEFINRAIYAVGVGVTRMTAADFNNDGKPDLAAVNCYSDDISILINNGDGLFSPSINYQLYNIPYNYCFILSADFDNDGDIDLAYNLFGNSYTDSISFLINDGEGTFQRGETINAGTDVRNICTADVDNDGDYDFVLGNLSSYHNISILTNLGNGFFEFTAEYTLNEWDYSIVAYDINNDSSPDLIGASARDSSFVVIMNIGDGTFGNPVYYYTGQQTHIGAAGNLNNDGFPDLVVETSNFSNGLLVYFNDGSGSFYLAGEYLSTHSAYPLCIADFDHDGDNDLALVASSAVSIYANNGGGGFESAYMLPCQGPTAVCSADFDGDFDKDLAITNEGAGYITIKLNNGQAIFENLIDYPNGEYAADIKAADLNGDGMLDLAIANCFVGYITILLGGGDGYFDFNGRYSAGDRPYSITTGDFDGDGDIDLAVANIWAHTASVLFNDGTAVFGPPTSYHTSEFDCNEISSADFDHDGDIDLVTADMDTAGNSLLFNNGNGTFQPAVKIRTAMESRSVVCADLNDDGNIDLAFANDRRSMSIRYGNGNGSFQDQICYEVGAGPIDIIAVDINGDSTLDLITANMAVGDISLWLNNGDGSFHNGRNYGVGAGPRYIISDDFDGDTDFDIMVVNGYISVLLNRRIMNTNVSNSDDALLRPWQLSSYPNPFNAQTTISYSLPMASDVSLDIFDLLGRKIETLASGHQVAGEHSIIWNAGDTPSGVYFYRLKAGERIETNKMVLLK
jgi:hypothetical protein